MVIMRAIIQVVAGRNFLFAGIALLLLTGAKPPVKKGKLKISFANVVKGMPVVLYDSTYTNPFGESYTVSRFKYYISHISLGNFTEKDGYHLVDESQPGSLSFTLELPVKKYNAIRFMIGVDSMHNVSGAQSGALDPRNDMFWTWNSGYIMFKFEGSSPVSTQVNNKIEYHVGGYGGPNKAIRTITLPLDAALDIRENKTSEVIIEADIDKWWRAPNDIRIADNAVSMTPGPMAKKLADNYSKIFSIKAKE